MYIPKPIYFWVMITCSAVCFTAIVLYLVLLIQDIKKRKK